jgi:hypothetical protein
MTTNFCHPILDGFVQRILRKRTDGITLEKSRACEGSVAFLRGVGERPRSQELGLFRDCLEPGGGASDLDHHIGKGEGTVS